MAQRTRVLLEDDLDGGEAVETILFGLDGSMYEIDLNEHNAAQLRDAVAPFVGAGRRAGRSAGAPTRTARSGTRNASNTAQPASDVDPKTIRAWAEANGVQVSARGRLSAAVVERYRTATG